MREFLDSELFNINEACKQGMSEREIKARFNLTDWDYIQARKILACYGVQKRL